MQDKKSYHTKQKSALLDFFKRHKDECFSAKQIIGLQELGIGEATVYRLLSRLAGEGKLNRFISSKDTGAIYQYGNGEKCDRHFHLKCLNCGNTACMDCSFMEGMEKHVEIEHEFSVDNTKTILYGVCKGCKQKLRG